MDSFNDVWKNVLPTIKEQVSEVVFNMWIAPLELVKYVTETDTVVFLVNAEYKKGVIMGKYADMISKGFEDILGFPVSIDIVVENIPDNTPAAETETSGKDGKKPEPSTPLALSTFDNFIVGKSNTFAYNAALAVAKEPGTKYNPLLIYGRSGLGKTHLMFAIYNQMKQQNPDSVIMYITAESFLSELVACIQNKNMVFFHNKYRNADALLVDDIQYIKNGEAVQEEFFHTFNELQQANKQIVMTSDVPPREMGNIDERLKTRFEMGVIADIQSPDVDTRKAIIKRKCEQLNFKLPENVVDYIAQKIKINIRQLEGVVKRLEAMTEFNKKLPSMDEIQQVIRDVAEEYQPVSVIVDKIFELVSSTFKVPVSDIRSDKRQANINQARQAAVYVIKEMTELTLKEIGSYLNKNHSTVLHAYDACTERMKNDPQLKSTIQNVITILSENK